MLAQISSKRERERKGSPRSRETRSHLSLLNLLGCDHRISFASIQNSFHVDQTNRSIQFFPIRTYSRLRFIPILSGEKKLQKKNFPFFTAFI